VHWDEGLGALLIAVGVLVCVKPLLEICASRRTAPTASWHLADAPVRSLWVGVLDIALGSLLVTGTLANNAVGWPFGAAALLTLVWWLSTDIRGWRRSRRQRHPCETGG
jgi:hypothetical protein